MRPQTVGSECSGSPARAFPMRELLESRSPSPRRRHTATAALQAARCLQEDIGCRLPSRDLLRGDRHLEVLQQLRLRECGVDQGTVRRRRDRQAKRDGKPLHGLDCAGDERQVLRVPSEHSAYDLVVDVRRRVREADDVGHVARPLGRTHAHHVRLCVVVPATAAFVRKLLAHLVPGVLRVDDDAVEIEDDRVDPAQARVTLSSPTSRTDATLRASPSETANCRFRPTPTDIAAL